MKIVTFFVVLGLSWPGLTRGLQQNNSSGLGSVRGQVIDADGVAVAGAEVSAESTEGTGGTLTVTKTDERGKFLLDGVPQGTNLIIASKPDDFYPDVRFAFFAVDSTGFPRVEVLPGQVTEGVTVRLTQKGARLTGAVLDSQTRQPVTSSRIRLTRRDDPRLYVSTNPDEHGRFDFIVPARPFSLEVSAPGYRTWSLPPENGHPGVVSLGSGSVKEQTVLLEPTSSSTGKQQQ